jgi:hypothetical protein
MQSGEEKIHQFSRNPRIPTPQSACYPLAFGSGALFGIEPTNHHPRWRKDMGILEEAAGAFAAVEGVKKLDPNAGILTEGVAAIAGFEGTKAVTDFIEKKEEEKQENQG